MSGHLSAQRIERYHQGRLEPAELLTVGDHLARCAACREQMGSADQLRRAFVALGTDLETAADNEPAHLSPEQMAAYVDNQLEEVDRLIADSHLDHCVDCHTELLDLRRLKTALGGYPAEEQPPIAVPVRRNRLAALGLSPARWLPLTAAAALVLLFVWLGLIPLRQQVTKLNEQLSELRKGNDALEERITALAAIPTQESHGNSPVSDVPMIVALNDSGRLVTLDEQGHLAGLKSLSETYEQQVKAVLTEQRVIVAPLLAELAGKQGVIMGPATERTGFSLRSPVGIVTETDRPTFRWGPLGGAGSYTVAVYNVTSKEVIVSASLSNTEWTPPNPLKRGFTYAWEVTALRDGKEFRAPMPPVPQAKFSILQETKVDELNRAKQMYSGSHLMLGILYAQAGLLSEAQREFEALAAANPDSLTAQKLLRSVKTGKNH